MKIVFIILVATIMSSAFGNEKDGVYYWLNHKNKIFSYIVFPDVRIEVEKLGIEADDVYASIYFKGSYREDYSKTINALAGDYKKRRVQISSIDDFVEVNFIGTNINFSIQVLHSPNGIEIVDRLYISKKTYTEIMQNKKYSMILGLNASPIMYKAVEEFELSESFCDDLFQNGDSLLAVSNLLKQQLNKLNQQTFKYSSTLNQIKKEIPRSCFDNTSFWFRSFYEIFNYKLIRSPNKKPIIGRTFKNVSVSESIKIDLSGAIE